VRKNSQASPISIDLRKIILFTFQFSAFLHRLGHELPRRALSRAAARPPITDTEAQGLRGRDGP
jgi:hypothetical protein